MADTNNPFLTKEELIQWLKDNVPDGALVAVRQPTHDYWKTDLAVAVGNNPLGPDEVRVAPSTYHNGEMAVVDEDRLGIEVFLI